MKLVSSCKQVGGVITLQQIPHELDSKESKTSADLMLGNLWALEESNPSLLIPARRQLLNSSALHIAIDAGRVPVSVGNAVREAMIYSLFICWFYFRFASFILTCYLWFAFKLYL
jgi:hypothetical protein